MADDDLSKPDVHQLLMAEILSDLAKLVGLDELQPDDSDYCALEGEGDRVIHLQREDDMPLVMMELGPLPIGEDRLDAVEALLAANVLWKETRGATISLDSTTSKALIAQRLPLGTVAKDGLFSVLDTLLMAANDCGKYLVPDNDEGDRSPQDQLV